MTISSRTPEGTPNRCPVCGSDLKIEPSIPPGDAPCPSCGHLLWFTWDDLGDVQVIKPTGNLTQPDWLDGLFDSVTMRQGMQLLLDLEDVSYLSSTVLGKLINMKKKLGAVGGTLRFRNAHLYVRKVLRICQLDQMFEIEE
jgi:anti-anti-sigma factor